MLIKPRKRNNAGMTLIEIMIVIAVLGTLMGIIITNLAGTQENAKIDQTKLAMAQLSQKLQLYRVDNGRYPTTDQGLAALVRDPGNAKKWRGPYGVDEKNLKDPFDNDFGYESDGREIKIISGGPDGEIGSSDDIFYPDEDGKKADE